MEKARGDAAVREDAGPVCPAPLPPVPMRLARGFDDARLMRLCGCIGANLLPGIRALGRRWAEGDELTEGETGRVLAQVEPVMHQCVLLSE